MQKFLPVLEEWKEDSYQINNAWCILIKTKTVPKSSIADCHIEDSSASVSLDMEMPTKKIMNEAKELTTFVQTDTKTFKDVVQRLTGSPEAAAHEVTTSKGNIGVKKPEFKLHERRQYKAKLEIIKPPLSIKQRGAVMQQHYQEQHYQEQQLQPFEQQKFSPSASGKKVCLTSPMTTPTKCFSSLSLIEREIRGEPAAFDLNTHEEEKAIRERRFYLHPSPRSKPEFNEPELLSLFPLTSPKTGVGSGLCQGE